MDYKQAGMVLSAVLAFRACDDEDAPRETDTSGPADTDTDTPSTSSDFDGCGSSTCGVVEQCYRPPEGEPCAGFTSG